MASLIGTFRKGEDISVGLDAASGDPASVTAITATMRKVRLSGSSAVVVDRSEPIAVEVTARPADGCIPAGWTLRVPASITRDLDAGSYGLDARLEVGGGVDITDETAVIQLTEAMLS
jgi:hypothetical protein